jgi:RNA polymerase sigma-70 factor (ECF subfamily)
MSADPDRDDRDADGSFALLQRAQAGDRDAVEQLMARYLPRLRRWASGQLPRGVRDIADTSDLVQNALLNTFRRIETLEAGRDGGLQAYLRTAIRNAIVDEYRHANRVPERHELDELHASVTPPQIDALIQRESLDRYRKALEALRPIDREAIMARVEEGCTYAEIAATLGKPSEAAARKTVERAMVRLLEAMQRDRSGSAAD